MAVVVSSPNGESLARAERPTAAGFQAGLIADGSIALDSALLLANSFVTSVSEWLSADPQSESLYN